MNDNHLSSATLSALADGELSPEQLTQASRHLAACPECTSAALHLSLLKSATARAGQRYSAPADLQERLTRLVRTESMQISNPDPSASSKTAKSRPAAQITPLAWAAAAVLILAFVSSLLVQRINQSSNLNSTEQAALVTEVSDQHIATLAANLPPQVLSSDRHTVKPWFQGKIPFSFNLPEGLPADTTLVGANLTYLHNRPVAQLLYSIGKHRVSVFVSQNPNASPASQHSVDRSGFHTITAATTDLEVVAISDVDPTRLASLVTQFEQFQAGSPGNAK